MGINMKTLQLSIVFLTSIYILECKKSHKKTYLVETADVDDNQGDDYCGACPTPQAWRDEPPAPKTWTTGRRDVHHQPRKIHIRPQLRRIHIRHQPHVRIKEALPEAPNAWKDPEAPKAWKEPEAPKAWKDPEAPKAWKDPEAPKAWDYQHGYQGPSSYKKPNTYGSNKPKTYGTYGK